jgi:ABC-2 type transport system ATP-binding protein
MDDLHWCDASLHRAYARLIRWLERLEGFAMIEVVGLTKRFGDLVAVDDLSFTAPAGQVTAVLGPNGAGKTTTFRMVLGLARPTAGRALIDGRPYVELARPRQTVGAVLESSGFHPARTGRNHLRVVAAAAGIPRSRVDELLAFVGLARAADRRVVGYSTGMRQRLAVAGALLGDPRVVVLDEPTSGLDPEGVAWTRVLLRELAAEGRCVLLASHLLAEVVQAADRVVIIARGRALREADLDSLDAATELAVRVDDAESLASALTAQQGAEVGATGDGRLAVRGVSAEEVGRTAARVGATVFELSSRSAGESLERLYLSLVSPEEREVR